MQQSSTQQAVDSGELGERTIPPAPLIPHPETCQKYISCYKSKAKEENCKKGYAYSSKLHLCVKQKGESCGANPEVTEPTVEPPTGSTSSSTESESDESSETGNTSGESNEAGNGNNSGESNETGTNPEEPAGKYDYVCENVLLGTKPHPETCQKYISCYKSKAKEENCKKGYAYSSKLHLCVKQKGNSCDSQGPGSEPTTVTTELVTEPETQTQPQTEAPTTTVTTTEITTEVETESEPQPEPTPPSSGGDPMSPSCEGDFTGYLAIEGDCVHVPRSAGAERLQTDPGTGYISRKSSQVTSIPHPTEGEQQRLSCKR
uniref:Chitin-binding type-2 domain-containing protein n=1 Tax=Anopheles albimanus TaxID=7167 RepID=A0A182FBF6_ANOAL